MEQIPDPVVAPFTGAWIEIRRARRNRTQECESHPSRVRGLKCKTQHSHGCTNDVAPFTGAWIEILSCAGALRRIKTVAPFTGAWIEIIPHEPTDKQAFFRRTLHGCVD